MSAADYIAALDKWDSIIRPGLFVVAILLIILELLILSLKKAKVNRKGGAVSLISGAFVFGFEAIADVLFYLAITYWLYNHRILDLGFKWYVWVLCFVLYDLMFYVSHMLQHKVRVLWCFHSTHHSSEEMRLSSAVRGSMFDFIYTPPFFIWICLLGIHPLIFITVRSLSRIWGILEHISEPVIGGKSRWNLIFITPDVHRVHHGKNYQYLDKNYSEILSIWDRIFGTYKEYDEQPIYGILRPVDPSNFFDIQFGQFKELLAEIKVTDGWANKLKLALMPPGWHPDGGGLTVKSLQRGIVQNKSAIQI
jgi:sterol desaturase/sphingolipid hydroxylase (fatty acid hydroxylase superfamily)